MSEPTRAPICGAMADVILECQNEPDHFGEHWFPRLSPHPAPDAGLRAALLHVTTRRHKFTAKCDGCWNARELTRAALALPQPGEPE